VAAVYFSKERRSIELRLAELIFWQVICASSLGMRKLRIADRLTPPPAFDLRTNVR